MWFQGGDVLVDSVVFAGVVSEWVVGGDSING